MSVKVTIKRNFPNLLDIALPDAEIMREVGLLGRELIVRRTQQAQGPDGPFEPLSPGYAEQKRRELDTARPDLTVSGNMLNDLTITDVTDRTVTLGWDK